MSLVRAPTAPRAFGWPRREILALAPAGLTAAAFATPGRAAPCGDRRRTGQLVTGFAPRGENARTKALDAATLPDGDESFARDGARITIQGVFNARPIAGDDVTALSISVDFSPFQPTVYHAWGFEREPVANMSGPVSLTVPIAAASGLSLLVDLARPTGAEQVPLRFAVGEGQGTPKLRQGTYVLAWRNAKAGLLPDLANYQWQDADADGRGRLVRHDWRRGEWVPAAFDYVVLAVDRVDDGARPAV